MWSDRRLTDLLGIAVPIIQAPMLGSVTPELAATVSNAGGLGSLAFGVGSVDDVTAAHHQTRRLTNAPFNLNFFVMASAQSQSPDSRAAMRARLAPFYRELNAGVVPDLPSTQSQGGMSDALVELLEALRPAVVSFHFGLPSTDAIGRFQRAGIKLLATATNVAEAMVLEDAGIDAIIAQGWEAGGHRGSHVANQPGDGVGTMALVPQVVDAVRVPVIAAGGIGDGRGIAAAFALGAAGVQMGTAFLSCPEAGTDARRREHLAHARDTDTMVTDALSGRCARAKRSRFAEAMAPYAGQFAPYHEMYDFTDPLCEASAQYAHEPASFHIYGQAASLNRTPPAAKLIEEWVTQARALMAQ